MRFGILGRLQVTDEARAVPVPAPRQRAVLAALLLSANRVLPAETLAETVWDGAPPKGADNTVRAYVMRLRRTVGTEIAARIETHDPGYLIRIGPQEFDADTFEALCRRAGTAAGSGDQWPQVADAAARALALWRGTPLIDVPSRSLSDLWLPRLEQQYAQLLEWRIEADLDTGRADALIPEIHDLLRRDPLREPLYRLHMLALAHADRAGEALAVYREARARLIDQLGVEPGPALRELHRQILAGQIPDPRHRPAAPTRPRRDVPRQDVPRQLPVDTRVFTGRAAQLDGLLALADRAEQGTEAGMIVISSINGLGGMGKTALAVRAGHRMAEAFPDGQLFIDLRGFSDDDEPVPAGHALDALLRSLGVPPPSIPRDLGERAALYRSVLAGTRTLIVLDNAADTAQVRPLLPGAPGSLVLITSRNTLAGLDDAHTLTLDVLAEGEAVSLLRKIAGPDRAGPDDPDTGRLVALCGHLPLAVRIVAARLRHHRSLSVADLVAELRDEPGRVRHVADGERNLTSVFDASYRDLPGAERDLFRRLGLVPGPDFDAYGVANLVGAEHRATERLLESLLDHSLLVQHVPGRYRLHDLLRAYARSLPAAADGDAASVARLADYYRHLADTANLLPTRWTRPGPARRAPAPAVAPAVPDRAAALSVMQAELDNMVAMIATCSGRGREDQAVALTGGISVFLNQDGRWTTAAALLRESADLSAALGDRATEAEALWNLGSIQRLTGDLGPAVANQERAIALYRELGDRQGLANSLSFLGMAHAAAGRMPAAAGAFDEALPIFVTLGDQGGEIRVLQQLGSLKHMMGDSRAAQEMVERVLAASEARGDQNGQAVALGTLGRIHVSDGHFDRATRRFEACLELFRALGNRQNEAQALNELSRTRLALADYPAAAELSGRALTLSRDLGFQSGTAAALLGLGQAAAGLGDLPAAIDHLDQALAAEADRDSLVGQSNAALALGQVLHTAGQTARARETLDRALEYRQASAARGGESEIHRAIADLLADTAGPEHAVARYRQALDLAREVDRPMDTALALEGLARCQINLGDHESGLRSLAEAVDLYERLGAAAATPARALLTSLRGRPSPVSADSD